MERLNRQRFFVKVNCSIGRK